VDNRAPETLFEARIPSQQFRELGLREGDMLVATPRKTRVFLDAGANI
jgi:sulfate transport system ATP-binding protein